MNNTRHAHRLLSCALTSAALAAACAGDTVYLPSAAEVRAQAQQRDSANDAGEPDDAVDAGATIHGPDTATYCRVVDYDAAWEDLQLVCDLDAPQIVLEIPDCPCTAVYGCTGSEDAGIDAGTADTDGPSFAAWTFLKTCEVDFSDATGSTLSCARYVLAVMPCVAGDDSCTELPETSVHSLRDGLVPPDVCSVRRLDTSLHIDPQGYVNRRM